MIAIAIAAMPHIKKTYVGTTESIDFLSLTHDINAAIKEANATNGVVHVVVPKGGAGLMVFENLSEVRDAIAAFLEQLVNQPHSGGEGGTQAPIIDKLRRSVPLGPRVQTAMLQRSFVCPVVDGALILAPYEEVILVDCEKRSQRREVVIAVTAEEGKAE